MLKIILPESHLRNIFAARSIIQNRSLDLDNAEVYGANINKQSLHQSLIIYEFFCSTTSNLQKLLNQELVMMPKGM